MKIKKFFTKLLRLLYPKECLYCGATIEEDETECPSCAKEIVRETIKRAVLDDENFTVYCVSPFRYDGKVREAIHKYKFRGRKSYARVFAREIFQAINRACKDADFSGIAYVPLSKSRAEERGYNQARLLADELSKLLGIPVIRALRKIKNNFPQHRLKSYEERERNVKGVYASAINGASLPGTLILCDDIITSGNTLKECVKTLRASGFSKILCVSIASAGKRYGSDDDEDLSLRGREV